MADDLIERLLASAAEVEGHPHPSNCDHLHVAFRVMREAADALSRAEADHEPTTPAEIALALRSLGARMKAVGDAMNCCGGFDGLMTRRGFEIFGAGAMAEEWADNIDAAMGGGEVGNG